MASEASSDSTPNAKQVVFLFMAATVVAVVVFLCGVLVGRGVPLGEGLTGARSEADGLSIDDLPPATLSTPSSEPSAAASESAGLSYYRRLENGAPQDETLRVPETAVLAAGTDGDSDEVAPAEVVAVPPEAEPVGDETPAAVATSVAGTREGLWVQVAALRSEPSAQEVVTQLSAKGYPAQVIAADPGAPVVLYRVRVGPYVDRAEAQRVLRRLETEEQLAPFLTR